MLSPFPYMFLWFAQQQQQGRSKQTREERREEEREGTLHALHTPAHARSDVPAADRTAAALRSSPALPALSSAALCSNCHAAPRATARPLHAPADCSGQCASALLRWDSRLDCAADRSSLPFAHQRWHRHADATRAAGQRHSSNSSQGKGQGRRSAHCQLCVCQCLSA